MYSASSCRKKLTRLQEMPAFTRNKQRRFVCLRDSLASFSVCIFSQKVKRFVPTKDRRFPLFLGQKNTFAAQKSPLQGIYINFLRCIAKPVPLVTLIFLSEIYADCYLPGATWTVLQHFTGFGFLKFNFSFLTV